MKLICCRFMKIFPVLIGISIAANVVLVAALVRNVFPEKSTSATAAQPAVTSALKPSAQELAAGAWAEVSGGDLAAQVERLRAEEFPPSVIRAIMAAQIREKFAARRKALEAADAETPFWIANRDPKVQAEQRALAREEQKALRDLLGPDAEQGTHATLRRMLPDLPAEKIDQVAQIRERYDTQRSELYSNSGGRLLPDEQQKLADLEKSFRAELATVLSPQELEDYELRASRTASQLRYTLAAFDPSEQEYRALFRLQQAFDEQFAGYSPGSSPEQMRARREAQQKLAEDIKATLGPERYADYQRATDYNFRRTTEVIARLNLPPETANDLYAVQRSVQDRANELRRAAETTGGAERMTQLAALAREAEATLSAKLGPANFQIYKEHAGSWLRSIAPQPPPAKKAQ